MMVSVGQNISYRVAKQAVKIRLEVNTYIYLYLLQLALTEHA